NSHFVQQAALWTTNPKDRVGVIYVNVDFVLCTLRRECFQAPIQDRQMAPQKFSNRSARDSRFFKIVLRPKCAVEKKCFGTAHLFQKLRLEFPYRRSKQCASARCRLAHYVKKTAGAMVVAHIPWSRPLDFNRLIL